MLDPNTTQELTEADFLAEFEEARAEGDIEGMDDVIRKMEDAGYEPQAYMNIRNDMAGFEDPWMDFTRTESRHTYGK